MQYTILDNKFLTISAIDILYIRNYTIYNFT